MRAREKGMGTSSQDIGAIEREVATLRRDLAALADAIRSRRNSAAKDLHNTADQLSGDAEQIIDALQARGRETLGTLSRTVEERPLAFVLLAFILGFLGSRMIGRR